MGHPQSLPALLLAAALVGCDTLATDPASNGLSPLLTATPQQAPPPTLSGEVLTFTALFSSSGTVTQADCPNFGNGTFTYTLTGTAVGPYPGTFTETGTVTISGFDVTGLNATFAIISPTGQVRGTKTLGVASVLGGACAEGLHYESRFTNLVYEATITTASGTFVDRGDSVLDFVESFLAEPVEVGTGWVTNFGEDFRSRLIAPEPGGPGTLDLNPPAAKNSVGTEHCVTATVRDAFGKPVVGVVVFFEVTGATRASGSTKTDRNGQATFCYKGPPLPGADVISAFADTDNDRMHDVGEPTGTATKLWLLPTTTPLCEINITNGGWITARNGDKSTFGGNAKASITGETQGQEEYQDHGPAEQMNVHSINVLAIVCEKSGEDASIYGEATIDGAGSFFYRIRVRDAGEPGVGRDVYGIVLGNGYASGDQILQGGNIQVRQN